MLCAHDHPCLFVGTSSNLDDVLPSKSARQTPTKVSLYGEPRMLFILQSIDYYTISICRFVPQGQTVHVPLLNSVSAKSFRGFKNL